MAMLLRNGKVLVFSGGYNDGQISNVEEYDPAIEIWTVITNLTHKPK
jgi:hypothetical protein